MATVTVTASPLFSLFFSAFFHSDLFLSFFRSVYPLLIFPSLSSSPLSSFSSSLFFFLYCLLPLSCFLLVFSPFFSGLSSLSALLCSFFLLLLCFYRQKQGRDVAGAATVLPPQKLPEEHISSLFSNTRKASGKWCRHVFEERDGGDRRRKIFFFPCFARPGEEEDIWCHSKRHRFLFFFSFLKMYETAPFFPKRARFI